MNVNTIQISHVVISILGCVATGIFTYIVLNWFYESREGEWQRSNNKASEGGKQGKSESAGHG